MSEREATIERNHALVGLEEDLSQARLAEWVVLEIEPVRVQQVSLSGKDALHRGPGLLTCRNLLFRGHTSSQ